MSEALQKAADYTAPMYLRFPAIRCVKFGEKQRQKARQRRRCSDYDDIDRLAEQHIVHGRAINYHYELDESDLGYEIEAQKHEAFGLEPQSIEVMSDVQADFVVVERGLLRAVLGFLD